LIDWTRADLREGVRHAVLDDGQRFGRVLLRTLGDDLCVGGSQQKHAQQDERNSA
jgi:hypothetical protein